jgi:hypothetical protein
LRNLPQRWPAVAYAEQRLRVCLDVAQQARILNVEVRALFANCTEQLPHPLTGYAKPSSGFFQRQAA